MPTNFLRMCSSSFGSTSKSLYFVRFALVRPCRTCRIQSFVFVFLLLDCQDEKMQTLPRLWTVTIKRCKHYMIFGLPRSIKANTTTLLDCQDQKKQTLQHFWTAKIRKSKHYNTFGQPRWEKQTLQHFWAAKMRKSKHYSTFELPRREWCRKPTWH